MVVVWGKVVYVPANVVGVEVLQFGEITFGTSKINVIMLPF